MKVTPVKTFDQNAVWSDIFLVLLGWAYVLRLVIWGFLLHTEIFFREDFANVAVAAVILLIAVIWAARKVICSEPIKKSGLANPPLLHSTL